MIARVSPLSVALPKYRTAISLSRSQFTQSRGDARELALSTNRPHRVGELAL